MQEVVVLGGDVAGPSAAHELVERGFEVEVYELLSIPGGQARNVALGSSGNPGPIGMLVDPPDEHGLRFFERLHRSFGRSALPGRPRLRRPSLTPMRAAFSRVSFCPGGTIPPPSRGSGWQPRSQHRFVHSGSVREAHDG